LRERERERERERGFTALTYVDISMDRLRVDWRFVIRWSSYIEVRGIDPMEIKREISMQRERERERDRERIG